MNVADPTYKVTQIKSCATAATCSGSANETVVTLAYNNPNLLTTSMTIAAGDGSISSQYGYTYRPDGTLKTADGPLPGSADTTHYFNIRNSIVLSGGIWTTAIIYPDPDGAGPLKRQAELRWLGDGNVIEKVERGTVTGTAATDLGNMVVTSTTNFEYDSEGKLVSQDIEAGGTTYTLRQYSYDSRDRLECVAVRMNPALFASAPASACTHGTQGTFGQDRITKYGYDHADRMTSVRSAYGTSEESLEQLDYTANSQIAHVIDAELNRTTYEYDGHDRRHKVRYPIATKGANSSSTTDYEQFTYDAGSNVTQVRLRDGTTITLGYNNLSQITSRSPSGDPTINYSYDLVGRLTQIQRPSDSATLTNGWDALGRLTSEAQP